MPRLTQSQHDGDEGEKWFDSNLPRGWKAHRPWPDVGVDRTVVVLDDSALNGHEFRVQVKAFGLVKRNAEGAVLIPGVKRSTLDYWFLSATPTLVVAVDLSSGEGFYLWHQDIPRDALTKAFVGEVQSLTLTIPPHNRLDASGWTQIGNDLLDHHRSLVRSLRSAEGASRIEPVIHELAEAAKQLTNNDRQRLVIPIEERSSQQEGIIALTDMIQHRAVLRAADMLVDGLDPASPAVREIRDWQSSYHDQAASVFPELDSLPEGDTIPGDFRFTYARQMHSIRPVLILAIVSFIVRLTLGPHNRTNVSDSAPETSF